MARILYGKEVAAAMNEETLRRSQLLQKQGIKACLAIVRCGEKPDDVSYERGAARSAALTGIELVKLTAPESASRQDIFDLIHRVNVDKSIHGCLILRPLPGRSRWEQDELCATLSSRKDVDCCTPASYARLFMGDGSGFAPCTAQACMELLRHYDIDCRGKRAAVLGRSLVVGKPVSMLLMNQGATVTVCHSQTENLVDITREVDIIICASGVPGLLTAEHLRPGQTVVDVSMNYDEEKQGFVGDAVFAEAEPIVDAISPVPGGVGAVTSAVLMRHVIQAAERSRE